MLLWVMGALTFILFFTPFLFGARMKRTPDLWYASGYFLCIGLGFMFVEVPWMQRFVLYLGHPSYASTVVLTSLLLGAGVGSSVAARLRKETVNRWGLLVPAGLLVVNLGLFTLFEATLGLPFLVRVAISGAVLVPTGFLMGFAFPLGMATYSQEHRPWLWAINGSASVLASVFSLALSIEIGFVLATTFGIVFYLAGYLLLVFKGGTAAAHEGIVGVA
jgi:hypothetical protein